MESDNDVLCYIVLEEWLYPTESGRDVAGNFDSESEAKALAYRLADGEFENYQAVCGDCNYPARYSDPDGETGYGLFPSNGLDEWFYVARVLCIRKFDRVPADATNETKKGE